MRNNWQNYEGSGLLRRSWRLHPPDLRASLRCRILSSPPDPTHESTDIRSRALSDAY